MLCSVVYCKVCGRLDLQYFADIVGYGMALVVWYRALWGAKGLKMQNVDCDSDGRPDTSLIAEPELSTQGTLVAEYLDCAEEATSRGDTGLAASYLDVVKAMLGGM